MPAYAEEIAQDLIMFVGNRWCFILFFSTLTSSGWRGEKGAGNGVLQQVGGLWCGRGGNSSIFLALWSITE